MAGISKRYGRALYDLAQKRGSLEACLDQAPAVRDALEMPESRRILQHPHISREEKLAFIQTAFSGNLHELLKDFLSLLIVRGRAAIAAEALTEFIQLGMEWRGQVEAHVVSAAPLRDEQLSAIQTVLARKLGKQVDMVSKVDPSLIGGFLIAVDGHCIDRTVQRRLADMRNSIEKGEGFDGPQTR